MDYKKMKSTKNQFTGDINSYITELTDALTSNGLHSGRMIGGSKSGYRDANPGCKPYFNACIYDGNAVQAWWGDLDLMKDTESLQKVSNETNQTFYVTIESYRSDFNKDVTKKDLENALEPEYENWFPRVVMFEPNGDLK